jgi:phosphatidylglycerophosphate synthase
MNLANLITVLRFPLLLLVVALLYFGGSAGQFVGVSLIALLILMDSLDGIIARRRHEETLLGGMLDIAADRAVEIVLWVVFAHLGLIPLIIPVIFIVRGALAGRLTCHAQQLRRDQGAGFRNPGTCGSTPVGRYRPLG